MKKYFKLLSIFNECGKCDCGKRASSRSEGRAEGLSKMKGTRPGNVAAYRQNLCQLSDILHDIIDITKLFPAAILEWHCNKLSQNHWKLSKCCQFIFRQAHLSEIWQFWQIDRYDRFTTKNLRNLSKLTLIKAHSSSKWSHWKRSTTSEIIS